MRRSGLTLGLCASLVAGLFVPAPAWPEGTARVPWIREIAAALNGTVDVEASQIEIGDMAVSAVTGTVEVAGGMISLEDARGETAFGKFAIRGTYDPETGVIDLDVESDRFALTRERMPERGESRIFDDVQIVPSWFAATRGRAEVNVAVLAIDGVVLDAVHGPLHFLHDHFRTDLRASLGDGSMTIRARHDYAPARSTVTATATGNPRRSI